MKKHTLMGLTVAASALAASFLTAQPTDNPVTASGIDTTPYDTSWIDSMVDWSNVTTTAATANDGLDDLAVVQAEINSLSTAGGGVLYFPSGTYNFSDTLLLADGVVLRGDTPSVGDARGSVRPEFGVDPHPFPDWALDYIPPTTFQFPIYEHDFADDMRAGQGIREAHFKYIVATNPSTDSNYGVVNIDINGAAISIGERAASDLTWGTTIPKNRILNQNILIFGNRINNAANLEPSIPRGSQNLWQIWPTRVRGKIDITSYANTLIGNNVVGDIGYDYYVNNNTSASIMDFVVNLAGSEAPLNEQYLADNGSAINGGAWNTITVRFSDGYGIRLNHIQDYVTAHSPIQEPSKYRTGMGAINNWVFNTTRVGYMIAGNGAVLKNNVKEDYHGTKPAILREDGRSLQTNSSATNENRGYDITGGNDVLVDGNYGFVKRGTFTSGYGTVDGEGILLQESSSTHNPTNWTISNNRLNSYIGLYRIRYANGIHFEGNIVDQPVYTDGSPNGSVGRTGGTVSFKDNTATALYSKYTIKPRNYQMIDQGGNSPAPSNVEGGNGGTGDGAVETDAIPGVTIISPTLDQWLNAAADDVLDVVVEITRDPADVTPLLGVKFFDGLNTSKTNGKLFNGNDYWAKTEAEWTAETGGTGPVDLVLDTNDGLYKGTWTVPADHLMGLPVAEVRLETVVVNIAGTEYNWSERNWGFLSTPQDAPAIPLPANVIMAFTGTNVEIEFYAQSGYRYQLQRSTDLSTDSWTDVGAEFPGSDTEEFLFDSGAAPSTGSPVFYRVRVVEE